MVFLQHLSELSGNETYSNFAKTKMEHLENDITYWKDISNPICDGDGLPGCTPAELVEAESVIRSWSTYPTGIAVWDLYHFVEFAQKTGQTPFANNIANEINSYMSQAGFDNTIDYYEIGLSAGILGLKNAGLDYNSTLEKLVARQNANGSFTNISPWGPEPVQETAYALMVFHAVGSIESKKKAALYLRDNFGYKGLDGWLENDGSEYSEITSEVAQALYNVTND
ncbi:MAG: hypothetical protein ABFQ65_01635 [Nanoarchaeota archaeon]